MATHPMHFKDFVRDIKLTDAQRNDLIDAHTTLRESLAKDDGIAKFFVCTFLQGSYRRATVIKPQKGDKADVDVVLVTTLDSATLKPKDAFQKFQSFMDTHYKGKWHQQGRSLGIELEEVKLDLVITATPDVAEHALLKSAGVASIADLDDGSWEPSELWKPRANEQLVKEMRDKQWKARPLLIPDRDTKEWQPTNPLEQIRWTHAKNRDTNGHYLGVVRAIKWWYRAQRRQYEHPQSYPLEHMAGDCCPNGVTSLAEGLTRTLEEIVRKYAGNVAMNMVPVAPDRGVPANNVLKRIEFKEFKEFYDLAKAAAARARQALDEQDTFKSCKLWRELLGSEFPECDEYKEKTANVNATYTERTRPSVPPRGNFATQ